MAQNCLYIGTVLPFRRKSISVILGTVKTLHSSRSGSERLFSISVKVVVSILFQKARKVLNNERGEANYFSTVVFIFIAVLLLAFIIDLFSIISTKQELDHAADQMVKQIQLSGGVNGETDELFEFLSSQIEGAENISYSIDATYTSPRPSGMTNAIQLGTPFFITIEGDAKLGGFWNFDLVNITVVARGSGVSEVTYETHIPATETAAAKRTGRDHLFRLLFCGRHRNADFLPAPVRFHPDHLHQHPQRR